jgi:hypothetical protein
MKTIPHELSTNTKVAILSRAEPFEQGTLRLCGWTQMTFLIESHPDVKLNRNDHCGCSLVTLIKKSLPDSGVQTENLSASVS